MMTEDEVRQAIEVLYGEAMSEDGYAALERLLTELVSPGRAAEHRATILDELAP